MSSVQHLKQFISARLNAAAEAIFTEFEKTIVQYEEEIDRQRKLLEITWKLQTNVHTAEVPHQHGCKVDETVQDDQQLCNQKLDSNVDQEQPESAPIKEEEEEILTSQEEELLLKDETDNVSIAAAHKENNHSDPDSNEDHIPSFTFPVDNGSYLEGSRVEDSGSARHAEPETSNQTKTIENEESSLLESCCNTNYTAEKLFSCHLCGKCFHRNYDLLRHMRSHTGEKPYSCKICGKCFSHASDCMRHMRIHTGEKPYSCKICGKCFNQSSTMLRHTKTHTDTNLHSCQICGQVFRQKSNFVHHIKYCKGRKPYSC